MITLTDEEILEIISCIESVNLEWGSDNAELLEKLKDMLLKKSW